MPSVGGNGKSRKGKEENRPTKSGKGLPLLPAALGMMPQSKGECVQPCQTTRTEITWSTCATAATTASVGGCSRSMML